MRLDVQEQRLNRILVKRSVDGTQRVAAFMIRGFSASALIQLETEWSVLRKKLSESMRIEHGHWNWKNKADSVQSGRHMLLALESDQTIQGVVAIRTTTISSQLDGEQLLYVDYIEAAPWNLREAESPTRFLGVGTALLNEAVLISHEQGMAGRIGLHSLPQAHAFYLDRGMTDLGEDDNYGFLRYFEYNLDRAQLLLTSRENEK